MLALPFSVTRHLSIGIAGFKIFSGVMMLQLWC